MKCPICSQKHQEGQHCNRCGATLLADDEKRKALTEQLLHRGAISSAGELDKTVELSFRCGSDDGLLPEMPMPVTEPPVICAMYYTQKDVLDTLLRVKAINSVRYYFIKEFYAAVSEYNRAHLEAGDMLDNQEVTLADVLAYTGKTELHLIFAHRQKMIDRAGPAVCLYGCPVSSELEQQYAGVKTKTEIIDLEE